MNFKPDTEYLWLDVDDNKVSNAYFMTFAYKKYDEHGFLGLGPGVYFRFIHLNAFNAHQEFIYTEDQIRLWMAIDILRLIEVVDEKHKLQLQLQYADNFCFMF